MGTRGPTGAGAPSAAPGRPATRSVSRWRQTFPDGGNYYTLRAPNRRHGPRIGARGGGKRLAPFDGMVALLGILAVALLVGKLAPRITPAVELVLLGLIAAIVLVELASWSGGGPGPGDVLRSLALRAR